MSALKYKFNISGNASAVCVGDKMADDRSLPIKVKMKCNSNSLE